MVLLLFSSSVIDCFVLQPFFNLYKFRFYVVSIDLRKSFSLNFLGVWGYFDNVNDQFNDFYWKIEGCVERHAPVKELSTKEKKMKSKPWISPNITKLIKYRNKLFKRKKRQPNNEIIKELYNQKRNEVNREIKRSKKNYIQHFEENSNNIKKIWSGIRELVNIVVI